MEGAVTAYCSYPYDYRKIVVAIIKAKNILYHDTAGYLIDAHGIVFT